MYLLNQAELPRKERFRIAFRRPAFHAPQPGQSEKRFGIEPLLGALASEMRVQQFNLARQRRRRDRHVDIGLADVSIPLGNLVFENAVIAERIPRQAADLAMVLVRVVAIMREDHVGIDARLLALRTTI